MLCSVLLLSERTPTHGRSIESLFEDDALLVDPPLDRTGNATVAETLATLRQLGVDRIRVLVQWSMVAPDISSATMPSGFHPADPAAYPVQSQIAGWSRFDRIDEAAAADGIKLDFDLTGPAPRWAATPLPADAPASDASFADVYGPSATAFESFVEAAGTRYSGHYVLPGGRGHALPRVSYWSDWNEPNQPGWLSPQNNPSTGQPLAPALYRSLVAAFWDGLVKTGHSAVTDTLLIGELAPSGCVTNAGCNFAFAGHDFWSQPPISFLEDLYCVGAGGRDAAAGTAPSTGLKRLTGAAATAVGCPASGSASSFVADNPGLFSPTGLSEHPYSFLLAPGVSVDAANERTFAPLSDLPRLESATDAAFAAYGQHRRLPLYLTEYGYVTDPPNPDYPVTPAEQALYLNQAEYMAVQNPRVRALSQFELIDADPAADCAAQTGHVCARSNPDYWHNFEEGLEFLGGKPKPAFAAYRLPIFLPDLEGPTRDAAPRTPVEVWGMLRGAHGLQRAQIQWRGLTGAWRTQATVRTRNSSGILSHDVVIPATGSIRLAWTPPHSPTRFSRTVAVTVRAG